MARIREPLGLRRLDIVWGAILGIVIETITCILRFVLDLQSTRDTGHLRHFTFGLRIHHGYIGLIAIVFAMGLTMPRSVRRWGFVIGMALLVSDLVHHFIVLWYTTGSPQFDLVYPH